VSAYSSMAGSYNELMRDIDYPAFLRYYEDIFALYGVKVSSVLDIGCGTGTLSYLMADRGYDVVAADPSMEMLSKAAMLRDDRPLSNPLFLHQGFTDLDLYGTVDAAVCSLDCVNYITDEAALVPSFQRLNLFLEPGGVFIFDVISLDKYRKYRDSLFLDQTEDVYCVWQVDFDPDTGLCSYNVDIFTRRGDLWALDSEEHTQRAYSNETLLKALTEAGFEDVRFFGAFTGKEPEAGEQRIFVAARKPK